MSRDTKQILLCSVLPVPLSLPVFRRFSFLMLATLLFCAVTASPTRAQAQNPASPQASSPATHSSSRAALQQRSRTRHQTFSSAQQAAEALYTAARSHDENTLLDILGPDARDIVIWTDNSADRNSEDDLFAKKYEEMHRLVEEPDNETTLYVGAENWPLPIPLVERDGAWYFDCDLGRREILYRRIGENETNAVDVLHGLIDAENQYFANSGGPDGVQEYARHLNCSPGQRDGLYSAANGNDDKSNPIGPYLAQASYDRSDRAPFHGYFFRVLTAQGPRADGGARDYIVNGKMTGGFAFIAFPAAYRSSGVKTFVVNENGAIFEKDLGPKTTQLATATKTYNPDSTWTRIRPNQLLGLNPTTTAPK
jgi:hypothetical protein